MTNACHWDTSSNHLFEQTEQGAVSSNHETGISILEETILHRMIESGANFRPGIASQTLYGVRNLTSAIFVGIGRNCYLGKRFHGNKVAR
jgi:hypothetical protein